MTTALVFYNMSVVIFASCFEYAILGCYNLIRMDMYQTSIDYFLLQFQLIFNGAAYVLAVTLLCLQPAEREDAESSRFQRFCKQCSRDIVAVCSITSVAILFILAESITSCYLTEGDELCRHTWSGSYRIAFGFFYALFALAILGSLQMVRIKMQQRSVSDMAERRKTYLFVFFCLYITVHSLFFEKFESECGHVKAKSTLPLVVVVVMALLVNFALELIHYNHFDGNMSGAVFRFAVHGQHLLHLALYVSFFISHENIMEEYIMLAVTALLAVYEVVAFVQSLYFKNSDHDKDKSEHGKKNEDEGVDTESAQEATVVQQSHSGVLFRPKRHA